MATDFVTALPAAAAALESRVAALEDGGSDGTGNLHRKAIPAPAVTHDDVMKDSTVSESEAEMSVSIYSYLGPGPDMNQGSGSGSFHHVNWSFKYRREAAKHLDVSAIKLYGGSPGIENAVLQSSTLKSGDGGFTATFLLQDETNDMTIEIDATPDIDYNGELQFVYNWTVTNNGANSSYVYIYAVTGITVLEHIVTLTGVEVRFDFGSEAFGEFDDFELEASVSTVDMGLEEDGANRIAGTIVGAKRSNQTVVTFHAEGPEIGVFSLIPPLVISTRWDGNIASLSFFDPNMSGEEIWGFVKNVADHMIISSSIKNEVEETA